jgi:hypothetical protein
MSDRKTMINIALSEVFFIEAQAQKQGKLNHKAESKKVTP